MADLASLDATAQLAALERRLVSAAELVQVARVLARDEPAVAWSDFDRALDQARAVDEKRARGDFLGLLAGLPLTVKETFDVGGVGRAVQDSVVVARLKAEGAIVWGGTVGAAGDRGVVPRTPLANPFDPARMAAGASAGSAVAVARGVSAVDIGSDLDGGLRLSAAFGGVFAHRPTFGLVETLGHRPPSGATERDLLAAGPVARSARDLRLIVSALARAPFPARAPAAYPDELRLALWLEDAAGPTDPEVAAAIEAALRPLEADGAQLDRVSRLVDPAALLALFGALAGAARADDPDPPRARFAPFERDPLSPAAQGRAARLSHRRWLALDAGRAAMTAALRPLLEPGTLIVAPAAPVLPPRPHEAGGPLRLSDGRAAPWTALARWSALASVCGLPAATVPVGPTASGAPAGLQIIGWRGADSRVIAAAQAFEKASGGFRPPPR